MDGLIGAIGGSIVIVSASIVLMDRHMGYQPYVGSDYVWHGIDSFAP